MSGNSKLLMGFFAGMAAGTALALFLSTDRGREIIEDVADHLRSSASEFGQDLKAAAQKGKEMLSELEERLRESRKPDVS